MRDRAGKKDPKSQKSTFSDQSRISKIAIRLTANLGRSLTVMAHWGLHGSLNGNSYNTADLNSKSMAIQVVETQISANPQKSWEPKMRPGSLLA
ncbi:MAG: hypothetical protein MMC33_008799 [Icmadophila ericetorum]|nr:hypothetical protein [Icmadophila ericetorum]